MNYIINPMWLYWLSVVGVLRIFVILLFSLSLVTVTVLWAIYLYGLSQKQEYGENDIDYRKSLAVKKYLFPIGALCTLMAIGVVFIPGRNTLIEMQVARYATYENAEWTLDTIKSAVDYIVEAIRTIK